jgi:NADH-quinone oxidoreductase subunit L
LGVLALGAVFAGMVWYNSFFGEEAKMRDWFGMEAAAVELGTTEAGAEAHGTTEAGAEGTATEATATEAVATEAAPAEAHGAPKGAIYLGADNHVIHEAHNAPAWVKVSPFVAMVLGFLLAWKFYIRSPELPAKLAAQQRPLYLFLLNKWYFDELYDAIFVRPAKWLGRFLWQKGDGIVIDGTLNGIALGIIPFFTRLAGRLQSGYVFTYAFAMVLGIAALLTWMTLSVGH